MNANLVAVRNAHSRTSSVLHHVGIETFHLDSATAISHKCRLVMSTSNNCTSTNCLFFMSFRSAKARAENNNNLFNYRLLHRRYSHATLTHLVPKCFILRLIQLSEDEQASYSICIK